VVRALQHAVWQLWETVHKPQLDAARSDPDTPASAQFLRVRRSAEWLGDNFAQVPLFQFRFAQQDPTGGSIFPAVWPEALAEGVGSLHHRRAAVLPPNRDPGDLGSGSTRGGPRGHVSFGYRTGRWGVAERRPMDQVSDRDTWGSDVGFAVPERLWVG
jgi:hypothetical protein